MLHVLAVHGEEVVLKVDRDTHVIGHDTHPIADRGAPVRCGDIQNAVLLGEGADQDLRSIQEETVSVVSSPGFLRQRLRLGERDVRRVVAARAAEASSWYGDGLLPGDVIYEINRVEVASLTELKKTIESFGPGDPLVLLVERNGGLRLVVLEVD